MNGATQSRREFCRTSRRQGSHFLSPVSFGETKEIGSLPVDYRLRESKTQQGPNPKKSSPNVIQQSTTRYAIQSKNSALPHPMLHDLQ
ncbi:hypothetical protein, partial [Comamonas sp.]|uniref:hypothetical protein n=1 Tax=Comamonas sp. TaxID=34028 RepID=UPI002FC93979